MGDITVNMLAVLLLASLAAGCVDAIVGGGGLITVPTLFAVFPQTAPALLLGTNKGIALCGTGLAASHYARRIGFDYGLLGPAMLFALVGSALGAQLVTIMSPDGLRQLLPFLLLAVLISTVRRKDFTKAQTDVPVRRSTQRLRGAAIGGLVGIYDGFFGPGTGSFFVFLLVRWLGHDFLQASANAKWLNVGTNVSALTVFAAGGHVHWGYLASLGAANIVGSALGTRIALRYGAGFVRHVFIFVVTALLLKTGYTAFG